jgi:DNA-binding CsgD family transcriptional regulator
VDLARRGLLLSLGVPAEANITAPMRNNLVRVATHMLAALRLRSRLGTQPAGGPPRPDGQEPRGAVMFPDGEVVHADGDAALGGARRALRVAVRDVARARTSLRHDSSQALALWKGLVAAKWTLVDRFESDGTRYVVAKQNAPRPRGLAALTPTERCVVTYAARGSSTKEIAYTLGISDATVRVLLMRAARRCGVKSRDALLTLGRSAFAQAE